MANAILADHPNTLRLYVYASDSFKIPRVREFYHHACQSASDINSAPGNRKITFYYPARFLVPHAVGKAEEALTYAFSLFLICTARSMIFSFQPSSWALS